MKKIVGFIVVVFYCLFLCSCVKKNEYPIIGEEYVHPSCDFSRNYYRYYFKRDGKKVCCYKDNFEEFFDWKENSDTITIYLNDKRIFNRFIYNKEKDELWSIRGERYINYQKFEEEVLYKDL